MSIFDFMIGKRKEEPAQEIIGAMGKTFQEQEKRNREVAALQSILSHLEPMDNPTRVRIISAALAFYGLETEIVHGTKHANQQR